MVLTGAACRQDYEDFAAYGREKGISTDELAEFTKQTLSRMVPAILQETAVSGLFLTGGDTAIAVILQLGASGSHRQPGRIAYRHQSWCLWYGRRYFPLYPGTEIQLITFF